MCYKVKLIIVVNIFLFALCSAGSFADTDKRVFHHSVHSMNPKEVSILFDFTDINQMSSPLRVWDGLWVKIINTGHKKVKNGVYGYTVRFATDPDFKNILLPVNQPARGITADGIAAFHFRNSDNSGPNEAGPKNVNAPQETRLLKYKGFNALIRVINMDIIGIGNKDLVPAFAGIKFIVIVKEKS